MLVSIKSVFGYFIGESKNEEIRDKARHFTLVNPAEVHIIPIPIQTKLGQTALACSTVVARLHVQEINIVMPLQTPYFFTAHKTEDDKLVAMYKQALKMETGVGISH